MPVVHDVDLAIAPGERVALVGSTGAGKTTVGMIAAGLVTPTSGRIRLAERAFPEIGRTRLRRHVALVSQDVHVFAGTIRDGVTLVAPGSHRC